MAANQILAETEIFNSTLANTGSYEAARAAVYASRGETDPLVSTAQPTGSTSQTEQGVNKITPSRITETNSQTPSTYWRDRLIEEANKVQSNNFRNTLSHKWADYNYEQTAGISNNIAKSNFYTVQQLRNEYNDIANKAASVESEIRNLERQNPTGYALVAGMYEKELGEYNARMDELRKELAKYGITTDGTLMDASRYDQEYFNKFKDEAFRNQTSVEYIPANGLLKDNTTLNVDEYISHIRNDEMQVYNYLAATSPKKADEYRKFLDSLVQQRMGAARAEEIEGMYNGPEKAVARGMEAYKSGLAGTYNAAVATLSGDPMKTSASQYATEQLRLAQQSKGDEWWRTIGINAAQSIGGMTPGVVAGMINPNIGAAVFGMTSAAGAYQEKLAEGWSKEDASTYGILVGAAEAGIGKAIGGIPALGGLEGGLFNALTKNINNGLAKAVLNYAGEMGSEFIEEGLQTYIAPAIEAAVKGTPYDNPGWKNALYSAVLGAVTSAGFGAPKFAGDVATSKSKPASTRNIDPAEALTGTPAQSDNAKTTEVILNANSLNEVVAATNSVADMSKASAKIRSDEAMLAELEQTVGRKLNNDNDVRVALAEVKARDAIQQKLADAVATGSESNIEYALEEIANNPRELSILNKYFGNIPGTEDGNIDFAKRIANGEPEVKTEAETAPAEEAIQKPVEAAKATGVQEIPAVQQTEREQAPVRLNQQENIEMLSSNTDGGIIAEESMNGGYADGKQERAAVQLDGDKEKNGRDIEVEHGRSLREMRRDTREDDARAEAVVRGMGSRVSGGTQTEVQPGGTKGVIEKRLKNGLGLSKITSELPQGYSSSGDIFEVVEHNEETKRLADWCAENEIPVRFYHGTLRDGRGKKIGGFADHRTGYIWVDVDGRDVLRAVFHEGIHNKMRASGIDFRPAYYDIKKNLPSEVKDELNKFEDRVKSAYGLTEEYENAKAKELCDKLSISFEDAQFEAMEYLWRVTVDEVYAFLGSADPRAVNSVGLEMVSDLIRESLVNTGAIPKTFFNLEKNVLEADAPQASTHSRPQPTDDAELTGLQIDEERETANAEAEYQERRTTDKLTPTVDEFAKQKKEEQRQQTDPKYDVAHEYGEDAANKLGDIDSRLGKLVDKQTVYKMDDEGNKVSKRVSRLSDKSGILNMAREVARGNMSLSEFESEYRGLVSGPDAYLYTEEIANTINAAARDVSSVNNTEYKQVTQEKKAADITNAFQMLAHRAEQAADLKITSRELSTQIRDAKTKHSKRALNWYFGGQATPDTVFKAFAGFDSENGGVAYEMANKALSNNVTEKRERSEGYSFFTDVTKHKDFKDFAKNKLMSGCTISGHELTAQEAVSLLHSLRSLKAQTDNYINGVPDHIVIEVDGENISLFDSVGKRQKDASELNELEAKIEASVTGVAKEYSEALDKMFAYYSPKFMNAISEATGADRKAASDGKYFPLFYMDGGSVAFNIAEAMQSRFEKLGFAKERVGPGETLRIAPAAQIADNYIEQVSHYIGWAKFSSDLNMLSTNIDGSGSFLASVANTYGKSAADMVAQYIKDVGGYKTTNADTGMNKLLSRFAGAVITGRPSTALSQLSSVCAAGGVIKPTAVLQAGVVFPIQKKHINLDDGLMADRSRHGINDSTISEITKNADSKIKNIIEKIPGGKGYLNMVGKADAYATKQIYAACWCDVNMDYPDLHKSNPKLFDTLVADKFAEALLFSQSDADKINNAAIYRTDNWGWRAVSMFTSQPNKQLNMVLTALGEYNAATGEAKKVAGKKLANVLGGQISAALSYSVLKTMANALLHKWYNLRDDDDEDESNLDEIGAEIFSTTISTVAGMGLFGELAANKLMDKLTNGKLGNDFDIQINGVSQVLDLAGSVMEMLKITTGEVPTAKEVKDLALNVANVTGIPLHGAYDLVNALALWGVDAYNISNGVEQQGNYDITKVIDKKIKSERDLSIRLTGKGILGNAIDNMRGNGASEERKAAQEAILALYEETGSSSSLPPKFSGEVNADIELSGEEAEVYQDNLLDFFFEDFEKVYKTDAYAKADAETQNAIVKELAAFAKDQARQQYYSENDIEIESAYKNLLNGVDVPGHLEDGSPKPDIGALDLKDIPSYLANKVIYSQISKAKDYDAIDEFLVKFDSMPENQQQQLMYSRSEIGTLIEARDDYNVDSGSYYAVMDSIVEKAREYDEGSGNAKSKIGGIYAADVSEEIKDAMADMLLGDNAYAFYMAAKSTSAGDPVPLLSNITYNDNEINQAEAKIAVANNPELEALLKAWWDNMGYKTSWDSKKLSQEDWEKYYYKYN